MSRTEGLTLEQAEMVMARCMDVMWHSQHSWERASVKRKFCLIWSGRMRCWYMISGWKVLSMQDDESRRGLCVIGKCGRIKIIKVEDEVYNGNLSLLEMSSL